MLMTNKLREGGWEVYVDSCVEFKTKHQALAFQKAYISLVDIYCGKKERSK